MLDDLKQMKVKTGQTKSVFVENRLNAILYQEMQEKYHKAKVDDTHEAMLNFNREMEKVKYSMSRCVDAGNFHKVI